MPYGSDRRIIVAARGRRTPQFPRAHRRSSRDTPRPDLRPYLERFCRACFDWHKSDVCSAARKRPRTGSASTPLDQSASPWCGRHTPARLTDGWLVSRCIDLNVYRKPTGRRPVMAQRQGVGGISSLRETTTSTPERGMSSSLQAGGVAADRGGARVGAILFAAWNQRPPCRR